MYTDSDHGYCCLCGIRILFCYGCPPAFELPQLSIGSNGEQGGDVYIGMGKSEGIVLALPWFRSDDMLITFRWIDGGILHFLYYNHSGTIVWDSLASAQSDASVAISQERPIATYQVPSDVAYIVVYCAKADKICTSTRG